MTFIPLFTTFLAFILISLSMKRHFRQLYPIRKIPSLQHLFLFRLFGYLVLFLSIFLFISIQGLGLGLVIFFGVLTLTVLIQVLLFSYRPKWIIVISSVFVFLSIYFFIVSHVVVLHCDNKSCIGV
jgi:drug/metabolite transporter (DMT)-like permease